MMKYEKPPKWVVKTPRGAVTSVRSLSPTQAVLIAARRRKRLGRDPFGNYRVRRKDGGSGLWASLEVRPTPDGQLGGQIL